MKHLIDQLVEQFDTDTACGPNLSQVLEYAGDLDKSPFLRAVLRKAQKLNIPCQAYDEDEFYHYSVLIDKETATPWCLGRGVDIDNIQSDGMSCVSEAVFHLLDTANLIHGKYITIVGNGHSVKGLAYCLIEYGATVTVAHSTTPSMLTATKGRDVVIYATPELSSLIAYDTADLVIDIGGCVPKPSLFMCPYVNNIGKLTVSVLLNRHAMGGC